MFSVILFLFQKHDIPLSKRIGSSVKSAVGWKSSTNLTESEQTTNDNASMIVLYMGSKAITETVVNDGSLHDSVNANRMQKIANAIDSFSRILFPLAFALYNIYYWAYY